MVPHGILSRLGQLRRRERLLRLVFGVSCFVAAVAAVILLGCLADWLWDRSEDTPFQIHVGLLTLTGIAAMLGFLSWVLSPQFESLPDDDLALKVESRHPSFRNRLISAVQLNRPHADRQGMSAELIGVMTKEAEKQAGETSFTAVADHGRLDTALKILVPLAVVIGGLWAWQPDLAQILLSRHFLKDVEIPRRTHLEPTKLAVVYPAGEKVPVRIAVTGEGFDNTSEGRLYVQHAGQPLDRYPLKFIETDPKTKASIFGADVAATSYDFAFSARLEDGRTKKSTYVRVVPRPAVTKELAFAVLPAYCGLKPQSKERYETPQTRGDIVGIPESGAKVIAETQKPIAKATIEILGPEKYDAEKAIEDMGPDVVLRKVPCVIVDRIAGKEVFKNEVAVAEFEMSKRETGYRIVVEDEFGLENASSPKRSLRIIKEEKPTVILLKDYFTPGTIGEKESLEDYVIDGLPVPIGKDLRVPYLAEGSYGIGEVWLRYRVLKKAESGNDEVKEDEFIKLKLPEERGTKETGAFDQRRGVFENTPPDKGVPFTVVPTRDPEEFLERTVAGGRVHFNTDGIPDGKGGRVKLNDGDKIEYYIEVHAANPKNPPSKEARPIAESERRVQTVGTEEGLFRWLRDVAREEQRLRELDSKQRAVFANP